VLIAGKLTEQVIALAIEVHRNIGRGLLESVYELCLCHELHAGGIPFDRQVASPVIYKSLTIGEGFKADIVVARQVILEIKTVTTILPVHEVQLLTYLSMSKIRVGPILNFHAPRMIDGLRRFVV
jgi:GxxExxY protein